MAVYSNLPTFTYIKWDNMMIAYNGQVYPIQNSYTNNKYVYFDTSNPYQLLCSNEKKVEIGGRFLIIINEKGIHTLVPHEDLVVTFDGENSDLIAEKIFGIYETNKEFGDKFVSVETDIEGVKTTVGKVERENNEIKESVSLIDQKADKISQEVKKIEKTFNESQDTIDLRERLNKSIIDINAGLGIFKSYFGEIKTGSLDTVTKTEINTHIDVLIKNKEAMILQVNKVEVLMEQSGFTDKLNNLTSSKTAAINAIDNLVTIIRTSISDNIYVPSEVTIIVDAFGRAATKINILKNSCDDCIFLGTGGSVVEELSRLDMKSDKIVLSVSKTEESLKNTLSVNKAQAQGQIQDLQTAISNFKQALKTIFEDGKVSEIEKGVISEHYVKLDKEKSDIDSLYNTYVSDTNLSVPQKNNLTTSYNEFVASHNKVKNKVNEVIQDGFVNESEMAQVDSELLKYEDQSNQLLRNICHALDDIEINRNNKAVEDAKKQLQQEINDVDSKVGDLDNTINTTFKDNIIDEAERNSIKQNLNILNSEKADVDKQYEQLYKNTHLSGQLKIDFKTAYDSFVSKYSSLVSIIEGILNKPTLIEDNDRRNMDNAYEQMNTALASFTTVASKVIENVAKKEAEFIKSQLDKDIEEVNNKIDGLDLSIDGTFVNNILDQAERKDIEDNLNILRREKVDVDNQYNQLIHSSYLDGQLKNDYTNKYNELTEKFTALERVITDILEKVDLINDTDRSNMSSAHESLNTVLGEFVALSNRVIEYIGKKQSESAKEDLTGQLGELNNKVDNIIGDFSGAIEDSVLDKSERQTLKESLNVLNAQKSQVDSQYTLVYNNENLIGSPIKNELKTTYDNFNQKYNLLINSIDSLLNKVENITEIDRNNYANSYNEYKVAISNYTAKLQLANEEIFNKGINNAKQELNNEISDVTESLTNLSNTMEGVFKDGILSESEKIAIRQNLKTLETEKLDIDKSYDTLYSNSKLIGSAKVNLKSAYDNYIEKYNNLISVINGILEKVGLIDSIDQRNLNTAFDAHKVGLGNFREKYSLALDSVTTKSVEDVKQSLIQDIGEVSGAIDNLQNTMNGVFKDGILSDSEKLAIKQNLQSLLVEKADIDKQYEAVYNNEDLLDPSKTNLKTAYDNYIEKYNLLISTINTIINKSGIVDSTDHNNLTTAFNNHNSALGIYSTRINEAIDSIAKKKSDDAYNNSKKFTQSEIKILSDSINIKVESLETTTTTLKNEINATTNKIDNIQIGGRNYAQNTSKPTIIEGENRENQTIYPYPISTPTSLAKEKVTISFTYVVSNYQQGSFKPQTNGNPYRQGKTITPQGNGTFTYEYADTYPSDFASSQIGFRIDNFIGDIVISNFKLEKGSKATDWTPAPEDIQAQIDSNITEISSTQSKVAYIETSLSGITSKVESVEQTQTTVNGKVTALETWKKSAEQKITDESIINTVSSQFYKKGETDSRYASYSEIKQLSNQISSKVDANGVTSIIQQNPNSIRIGFNGIDVRTQIDSDGISLFNTNGIKTTMLKQGNVYQYNGETGTFLGGYLSSRTRSSNNLSVLGGYHTKQWIVGRSSSWQNDTNNNPTNVTDYFFVNFVDVGSNRTGIHLASSTYAHADIHMQYNDINNAGNIICSNLSTGNNVNCYRVIANTGMQTNIWYNSGGSQLMRYDGVRINLGASINTNGYSVSNSSDSRLKQDIKYVDANTYSNKSVNLKTAFYNEFKEKFKFATYRYKNKELAEKEHFGFIAQDLLGTVFEKYILDNPQSTCEEDDYLRYDLTEFVTMIAGVLQEEIEIRDKQIEVLTRKIEDVKLGV